MDSLWSVLIGARQVRSRRQFTASDDKLLQTLTAEYFPAGYTILEARGGWFDPSARKFVRETSRQILVASDDLPRVKAWAKALGTALHQKELLLVKTGSVRRIRVRPLAGARGYENRTRNF